VTWDDDKRTFRSRPEIPTDERLTADEWNAHVDDQKDHADRHEEGGIDELVVDGLAGVLSDPQPPQEEAVEDFVADLLGGGDKVSVAYDDAAGSLTVNTSALDTEEVEDAVNALVAGGDGVATSYDDANGTLTLSIPDNSVTAAMLTETYFTESEADDRFYNVTGDTLEGDVDANTNTITDAGHDEVDVPQTRTLTVADFEGGVLPDSYVGDTGSFTVQSSVVDTGDFALEGSTSGAGDAESISLSEPVAAVPQSGDTFSVSVYATDTDATPEVRFATQEDGTVPTGYKIVLDYSNDVIEIANTQTGNSTVVGANLSNVVGEWVSVVVEWGSDGDIFASLLDATDAQIASLSLSDTGFDSGLVAFLAKNRNTSATQYFDSWTLDRRTPEYYSNTQNGTTELGNDVQPSGAIKTGPNELPRDTDQAILADQPVTDGLTQGERVSYGLYVAQQQIARVQAEANGTGGIQNPRLVHEELAVNPTRGADPTAAELGEGNSAVYVSDGSADVTGDDGDVILAVNSGGTVKTTTLADFSTL